MIGLKEYAGGKYSQNGEAGIIDEILKRLKIHRGYCMEFGANDGYYCSNTIHLLETGRWVGLYIEPYDKYSELKKLNDIFKWRITTLDCYIRPKSSPKIDNSYTLDEVIDIYSFGVDVLSIDVDNLDYSIFKDMEYKPKIVIIEINPYILPDIEYISQTNPKIFGTSFLSMVKLGESKGYKLVACTGNCIFLRDDLCENFIIPKPEELFDWKFNKELTISKDEI